MILFATFLCITMIGLSADRTYTRCRHCRHEFSFKKSPADVQGKAQVSAGHKSNFNFGYNANNNFTLSGHKGNTDDSSAPGKIQSGINNSGNFAVQTSFQARFSTLGHNSVTGRSYVNPEMTRNAIEDKDDGMLPQKLQHVLYDEWNSKSNSRDDYKIVDNPSYRVLQRLASRHAGVPRRAMYRGKDLPRPMYRVPEYLHEQQAQRRSEYDEYRRQHPYYPPRN